MNQAGHVSAAIALCGAPGTKTNVETWNGSAWTEVNDVNTGRSDMKSIGDSSRALKFGGGNPVIANSEDWNGVSWIEVADLSTARQQMGRSGSFTEGLCFGGQNSPTYYTNTEEWSSTSNTDKTISTD